MVNSQQYHPKNAGILPLLANFPVDKLGKTLGLAVILRLAAKKRFARILPKQIAWPQFCLGKSLLMEERIKEEAQSSRMSITGM